MYLLQIIKCSLTHLKKRVLVSRCEKKCELRDVEMSTAGEVLFMRFYRPGSPPPDICSVHTIDVRVGVRKELLKSRL